MVLSQNVLSRDELGRLGSIPFISAFSFYIRNTTVKGRAVFSKNTINPNTYIMCDPVERYSGKDADYLSNHKIYDHFFVDPTQYNVTDSVDLLWAIGPISLINHSKKPNCIVEWRKSEPREWALLRTLTTIQKDEELLISYTNIKEYEGYQNFI